MQSRFNKLFLAGEILCLATLSVWTFSSRMLDVSQTKERIGVEGNFCAKRETSVLFGRVYLDYKTTNVFMNYYLTISIYCFTFQV